MKKIVHIINSLNYGGAENMLYKLIKYSNRGEYYHEVISLMDEGVYGSQIEHLGIKVHCLKLNMRDIFTTIKNAIKICKDCDVIDTWLYHADIFGFFISKLILRKKLIWNIRHSNLDKSANKKRTLLIIKFNSYLSRYVDCITYNSNKSFETHVNFGYTETNKKIIPNGFEVDKFKFEQESRIRVRNELGISIEQKVIITIGRWNIQKDYYTLLKALGEMKKSTNSFKMIMCGSNLCYSNSELVNLVKMYELEENVLLLDRRDDVVSLLSVADIYVSSSIGESFSNSIAEAMACELVCIVTDVGDSCLIVGDTGYCIKPKDSTLLCNKLLECIANQDNKNLGSRARKRVVDNYDIVKIVKDYDNNYC